MRIVFLGTPDFAVASLEALLNDGSNVVGVITAPDKPAGRGNKIRFSPVKEFALANDLHILQPANLKDEVFIEKLKNLEADLQIVVAFRMLPEVVWNMPPLGTFNLHASLLPQYRGAAPINRAIMNGETETGVTTFFLQHEIDTGAILLQEKVAIGPTENAGELHDKLMVLGAQVVSRTVKLIASGNYAAKEQSGLIASEELKPAPKIFKPDCQIDWSLSGTAIFNHIRGLSPYPAAWTTLQPEQGEPLQMKVYASSFETGSHSGKAIGSVHTDKKHHLKIAVTDGFISLLEVQQSGKRKMKINEFLNGFHSDKGWTAR